MSSPHDPRSYRPGGEPGASSEFTPSGEPAANSYTKPFGQPPAQPSAGQPSGAQPSGALSDEAPYATQQYPAQPYPAQDDATYRPGQYDASNQGHADASGTTPPPSTDFQSVRSREKQAFGGLKLGSAFFGWLTSIGATVVLVAIVAAVARNLDLGQAVRGEVSDDRRIVAVVVVVVVLFVSYYCGGYVAGRMARFNGIRQGIAVWLWSVLFAAAVTALVALTDEDSQIAQDLDLPVARLASTDVTQQGLIALGIVLGVTLVGAIVGGLAGMRFHRRVDRAGFEAPPEPDSF